MKNNMKLIKQILLTTLCFVAFVSKAQNKILFVKDVPIKMKSESSYSFFVGYEVEKDSDIAMDISGGPNKFWAGKTVSVDKGKGVFQFSIPTNKKPTPGQGYRIVASVREKGGDWKTEKANSIIRNVEIVKKDTPILDDASFSLLTPTSLTSRDVFEFEINYKASQDRMLQVALWNGGQWIAASKNVTLKPGQGKVNVTLSAGQPTPGNTYRYVLYYGSGEGFPNKNLVSKEISGIQIKKAEKKLTLDDLKEKSITLYPNRNVPNVTLPGKSSFSFIRIITQKGEIVSEVQNTNKISISSLERGNYYVVTSSDDYYSFLKM